MNRYRLTSSDYGRYVNGRWVTKGTGDQIKSYTSRSEALKAFNDIRRLFVENGHKYSMYLDHIEIPEITEEVIDRLVEHRGFRVISIQRIRRAKGAPELRFAA